MRELADGLWQLSGFPPNAFNVYVLGDVLVDSATKHGHRHIRRQLRGRKLSAHALTHAHPDHQGGPPTVCAPSSAFRCGVPSATCPPWRTATSWAACPTRSSTASTTS